LNLPLFIARKISNHSKASFSKFIIRLATVSTALSVAIMIIAVAVVFGFKETIKDKIFVFWGNIQVTPYDAASASIIVPQPVDIDTTLIKQIKAMPEVNAVFPFAVKPAILNHEAHLQGIKFKGVDQHYPFTSNSAITFTGRPIQYDATTISSDVIVSQSMLRTLDAAIGDTIISIFIDPEQDVPRRRKMVICGTYQTSIDLVDESFAICDLKLIQRVNNWSDKAINGYQIGIKDYTQDDLVAERIYKDYLEPPLHKTTIKELYPNIYNWLELTNTNAYVILIIMAIVAVIGMSTAILIFIMERTNMVGMLKALGMSNGRIQQIFIYHALRTTLIGIALGNIVGIGLCYLQQTYPFIQLPEVTYYMKYVPVKLSIAMILAIDIGTFMFSALLLCLPILVVKGINIAQALKFK
jgi:lipoprotein-releasing system permease protein